MLLINQIKLLVADHGSFVSATHAVICNETDLDAVTQLRVDLCKMLDKAPDMDGVPLEKYDLLFRFRVEEANALDLVDLRIAELHAGTPLPADQLLQLASEMRQEADAGMDRHIVMPSITRMVEYVAEICNEILSKR